MILETLLFSFFGVGIGIFSGLMPGMHVNTLIPILFSLSLLLGIQPYYLAVLIVTTGISEIFMNFIPSIFLGAPEESTSLAVLPGHRLLLEGKGYEAIKLTVIGGIGAMMVSLIIISLFANIFTFLYEISRPYVHYLILSVVIFMIVTEKKLKKMASALLIILMSGLLGIIVLNSSLVSQQNTLFPILTGLFGLSTLMVSLSERTSIPKQIEDFSLKISRKEIIKSIVLGSFAGVIVGLLPAIGISQAAVMVQYLGRAGEARSFLVTVSGINVGNEVFSLINLFLLSNPRSGSSVAVQRILTEVTFFDILYLIGAVCFAAGISAVLTLYLGKKVPRYLERLNYRYLCLSVIFVIVAMIFLLTGVFGLLIAFTSTAIGLLCSYLEIRHSHCMGCLLVPSIIFFSGMTPTIISLLGI